MIKKHSDRKRKHTTCPQCESQDIAHIIWGYIPNIDEKLKQDLENSKVVLGGCLVTDHDPNLACNNCFHRWRKS